MNATDMNDLSGEYRYRLVEELIDAGLLTDPAWRHAWETVPRHLFVQRFAISASRRSGVAGATWYDGSDPSRHRQWLAAAYRNEPLITSYAPNGAAISSSTEPSLMA